MPLISIAVEKLHFIFDNIRRFNRFTRFISAINYSARLQVTNLDTVKCLAFTWFNNVIVNNRAGVAVYQ